MEGEKQRVESFSCTRPLVSEAGSRMDRGHEVRHVHGFFTTRAFDRKFGWTDELVAQGQLPHLFYNSWVQILFLANSTVVGCAVPLASNWWDMCEDHAGSCCIVGTHGGTQMMLSHRSIYTCRRHSSVRENAAIANTCVGSCADVVAAFIHVLSASNIRQILILSDVN